MKLWVVGRVTVFTAAALAMAAAAEVVTIGSKNYPLCEGTGSVDKECVTKGIYDQAELYEIHMPGSIICDSFLLLPGGNVWSSGLRVFLYLICLLYLFLGIAIIADVSTIASVRHAFSACLSARVSCDE